MNPLSEKSFELIIFHYHLLRGGVSDVIKLSLEPILSLENIKGITIVSGREENTDSFTPIFKELSSSYPKKTLKIEVFRDIDYLKNQPLKPQDMEQKLIKRWGGQDKIWLIHNYHLGKNWVFTAALLALARQDRQNMIFQIHDFPECGRLENLKILRSRISEPLYPRSRRLRYCVINTRDFHILASCGMNRSADKELFLLENPLPADSNATMGAQEKKTVKERLIKHLPPKGRFYPEGKIWLYPVRGIRRKNILEGGFIASLTKEKSNLVITLPGLSPQEKPYSELCKQAWSEGLIAGFWGTGNLPPKASLKYRAMIAASDFIFSSSVQEGFGYLYLNSLLWQKPLLARKLDIMDSFLPLLKNYPAHLYDTVRIPLEKSLKQSLKEQYEARFKQLDCSQKASFQKNLEMLLSEESIDYSWLSPKEQYNRLEKLKEPAYLKDCQKLNALLLENIEHISKAPIPDKNKEIHKHYGKKAYRQAFSLITASFLNKTNNMAKTGKRESTPMESPDERISRAFSSLEYLRLLYQ